MKNLTGKMEKYIKNKQCKDLTNIDAKYLYSKAEAYIDFCKSYSNNDNLTIIKQYYEDIKQDLVTTAYYMLSNGYYKELKGSLENFLNAVFNMVMGKYDVLLLEEHDKPYYKISLKDIVPKIRAMDYYSFNQFAVVNQLSPLTQATYFNLPKKELIGLLQLTNNQQQQFKLNDEYNLSKIKIALPKK